MGGGGGEGRGGRALNGALDRPWGCLREDGGGGTSVRRTRVLHRKSQRPGAGERPQTGEDADAARAPAGGLSEFKSASLHCSFSGFVDE